MSKSGKMTRLVMVIIPPTPMLGPIISIRVMTPAKMAIKLSFAMLMTFAPSSGGRFIRNYCENSFVERRNLGSDGPLKP